MHITGDNKLKKLIVIGDRLLIRPSKPNEKTESGLYLPAGVQEKEKVQQGWVIKPRFCSWIFSVKKAELSVCL